MTTSREQFMHDYLIVIMNNETSWSYVIKQARGLETDELATLLCDEFEEMVVESTKDIYNVAKDLLREILIGQGVDTWHDIAKYIKESSND